MALSHFQLDLTKEHAEFQAILAAMGRLEQSHGEGRSRLVFWFDN